MGGVWALIAYGLHCLCIRQHLIVGKCLIVSIWWIGWPLDWGWIVPPPNTHTHRGRIWGITSTLRLSSLGTICSVCSSWLRQRGESVSQSPETEMAVGHPGWGGGLSRGTETPQESCQYAVRPRGLRSPLSAWLTSLLSWLLSSAHTWAQHTHPFPVLAQGSKAKFPKSVTLTDL